MPGLLNHPPERIIQQLLLDLNLGTDPEDETVTGGDDTYGEWPVFWNLEPDRPDSLIKVSGTTGTGHGNTMPNGEDQTHDGFQVMVRADDPVAAFRKINYIGVALDRIRCQTVEVPPDSGTGAGTSYYLSGFKRMSGPIYSGLDTPQGKRPGYTINYVGPFRMAC